MKINENTRIVGEKVVLIPYNAVHVPKYHSWMQSEELQKLTASERLTLDEEYEMQTSWRSDEDKLTFLIMDKRKAETSNDEIQSLVGDSNLFLNVLPVDDNVGDGARVAEIEIMIAEPDARRRGMGLEAVLIMLKYGVDVLRIEEFIAKIGLDNEKSIHLFEKLHFTESSRSEVFHEVTLHATVTDAWSGHINRQLGVDSLRMEAYKK